MGSWSRCHTVAHIEPHDGALDQRSVVCQSSLADTHNPERKHMLIDGIEENWQKAGGTLSSTNAVPFIPLLRTPWIAPTTWSTLRRNMAEMKTKNENR